MWGLESPIARNFSVNYPPPGPSPRLVHKQFGRGLNPRGHHQQHRQHRHPARFASSIRHASFLFNSLMQRCSCLACSIMGSLHLGLASFPCCAGAPTSHLQLRFCTALSFPALPKVHSDAAGGPLNLLQSLVVMLAMLNFLILFVIITFASTSPQQTSPQYVGLHVHLTYMPRLQTRLSTSMKKLRSCAVTFVFSCQAPCQASFRPLPLRLKSRRAQCTLSTTPSFSSTFLVATKQINHLTFRRTTVGWKLVQFGNWCLYTGIS